MADWLSSLSLFSRTSKTEAMSTSGSADNGFQTDAVSSPPRDRKNVTKANILTDKDGIIMNDDISEDEKIKNQSRQKKSTTKTYGKTPPNSTNNAYANVINISHSNGIQIGSNYVYNTKNAEPPKDSNKEIVKSEKIMRLFNNKDPVLKEHISFVSTHVGDGWRNIGRLLMYSDGQIHQLYENYQVSGIKEVVYQLLLDWTQNEPDEAILSKLVEALWNSEQQDSVQRLADKIYPV